MIAPIVAAGLVVRFGWRSPIIIGAIVTIGAVVVFGWINETHSPTCPGASIRELFAPTELFRLLRRPHTRFTTYLATLVEFVGLAAMAFIPITLIEHIGFSTRIADLLFAVFYSVAAISQPDRWVCGYCTPRTEFHDCGWRGTGGCRESLTPVIQSRMLDGLAADSQETGFGLFRTMYLLFGSLGTTVVGTTADIADWRVAVGILAFGMGLIFLSITRASVTRRYAG